MNCLFKNLFFLGLLVSCSKGENLKPVYNSPIPLHFKVSGRSNTLKKVRCGLYASNSYYSIKNLVGSAVFETYSVDTTFTLKQCNAPYIYAIVDFNVWVPDYDTLAISISMDNELVRRSMSCKSEGIYLMNEKLWLVQ